MDTLTIFLIILMISASCLCVALIFYINKMVKSINEVEKNVKDISEQIKPLISSANELSEKLNDISAEAKDQLSISKDIVISIKDRVKTILAFEEKVRGGLEEPVNGLIKNLSAVVHGINSFWNSYKRKS